MVLGFTGEHIQKVDAKGRMSIPAAFRRVLEAEDPDYPSTNAPRMMLVYGDHLQNRLEGYSMHEFGTIMAEIKAMKRTPKRTKLMENFIGMSVTLDVDKDGRTVMPLAQRQKLGIDSGDLYFKGLGERFEIWRKDVHQETKAQANKAWLEEQGDDFDLLSLLDEEE
ncbi:MAG: cell division/cell wall cluster transcriptional repressor MraZ [Paracoccaceae bacterium]|nr:cell division/cell wall cluster transcriptional repressor MraZ [Loktanella sp.]